MTDDGDETADARDPNMVLFISRAAPQPGEVQLHAAGPDLLGRSLEQVRDDWRVISKQVAEMLGATEPMAAAGYKLDELTVELGFSAKGKLAFIAEAGVEASVALKFTRS